MVHSLFGEAFTPGTRFADERHGTIEVRTQVIGQLDVPSGHINVGDPLTTSFENPDVPLAQRAPIGTFPVEVSIARFESGDLRVACARVRFDSSAPATRWEVGRFEGEQSQSREEVPGYGVDAGMGCFFDAEARATVDQSTSDDWLHAIERNSVDTWTWHVADVGKANVVMFSSGWGDGFYGSWWGFDADGRVVELVTDFEVLMGPDCESFELPLPLSRGRVRHPLLETHDVVLTVPLLARNAVIASGKGGLLVRLSDGTPVQRTVKGDKRHFTWNEKAAPGARLVVSLIRGVKPLAVL
jgi:hypothetical protein